MPARPFLDTLIALRFGKLHDELTEALNELTNACTETGKGGTLTLSIKLKPGRAGQVEILDDVKTKLPSFERGSTLMFSTPDGNLQRDDPRQQKLELRSVEGPTGEIIDVKKAG